MGGLKTMGAIFQEDRELKGEWRTEGRNAGLHSNWHLDFKLVVVVVGRRGGEGGSRRSFIYRLAHWE